MRTSILATPSQPNFTDSKTKRRKKAAKYSEEKILERADETDRPQVESILKRLSEIPQFSWNKSTGSSTFGSQKLQSSTIESLINEYMLDKPALSAPKDLSKFRNILNNTDLKTHSAKKKK